LTKYKKVWYNIYGKIKNKRRGVRKMRTLPELIARSSAVLTMKGEIRKKLIEVAKTKSPSAAYDIAFLMAHNTGHVGADKVAIAKATRWLAIIKKNYEDDFEKVVEE
jgi:hypothetical protein